MEQGSNCGTQIPAALQALQRIAQAASDQADTEGLIAVALEAIFSLFNCDRAWLLYPCNAAATSYQICYKYPQFGCSRVRPNQYLPIDEAIRGFFRLALVNQSPVVFNSDCPLPAQIAAEEPLPVQTLMAIALRPHHGEPWLLGLYQCEQDEGWSEQEQALFQSIAEFLTGALNTLLRQKNLHEASRKLLDLFPRVSDEEGLLRGGLDILQLLTQAKYAVAGILSAGGQLKIFVFSGMVQAQAEHIGRLFEGKGLLGRVVEQGKSLRLDDLTSHSDSVGFPSCHLPMKSLLAVPIVDEGKVVGWIYLCDKRSHQPFTIDDEVLTVNFTGALAQTLIRFREMKAKQKAQEALFLEHRRAQVTLESIGDAVLTVDSGGWVDYLNPLAEELVGTTQSQAQGKALEEVTCLLDEQTRSPILQDIATWLVEEPADVRTCTALLQDVRGQEIVVQASIAPIRDSPGRIFGAVLVLRDISPLRALASQLSYQATHDGLTGLINRREFEVRLRRALDDTRQNDAHHVLCYLDLDRFKVVNDTCGHLAGDKLLRQLAALLQEQIREADCLARLGGDEFGVLFVGCHLDHARRIAENLRVLIRDYRFPWKGKAFQVGVSLGLVPINRGSGGLEEVFSAADTACYMAKEQGRNRIHTYCPDDSVVEQHYSELQWVTRIQQAFEESSFMLYSQPIRSLNGQDHCHHCEVLLQMKSEDKSLIPPMAFIPAAERYQLMPVLDRWVIRNTLAVLQECSEGQSQAFVSINLSGQSICDELFLRFVIDQLRQTQINPSRICFEIAETAAMANFDRAIRFIREFKEMGCRFALDDFGSGLSSFNYLKHLPIDYLKIDGNFVKDMVDDPIAHAMVEAIHRVGKVMGLKTIAEFAESEAILKKLQDIGIDYVQGFAIGYPQPFYKVPGKRD